MLWVCVDALTDPCLILVKDGDGKPSTYTLCLLAGVW